jgi:nucleoid-associated protein YgaU
MGREKRILLAFLGLLAGVFVGLLSKKLLVPRPPAGAGPDVDVRTAYGEPTELVEPPRLTLRASDFAAAPPLVAAAATEPRAARTEIGGRRAVDPFTADPGAVSGSGERPARGAAIEATGDTRPVSMFVRPAAADDLLPPPAEFAAATARHAGPVDDEQVVATPVADPQPFEPVDDVRPLSPAARPVAPMVAPAAASPPTAGGVTPTSFAAAPGMPTAGVRGVHVAQAGDSWWSIAESAYGDGRLYRAVFAWNRAVDPRVSLAVGTHLQLPPLDKLRAAWPTLVPSAP